MGGRSQIHNLTESKKSLNLYPHPDFFVQNAENTDKEFHLAVVAFFECLVELTSFISPRGSVFPHKIDNDACIYQCKNYMSEVPPVEQRTEWMGSLCLLMKRILLSLVTDK